MSVVDDSFGYAYTLEEKSTMPLAGGVASHGYQCGLLWGGALAAGARAYHEFGPGPQAETGAIIASQKLVETFQARTKNEIDCSEITHLNFQDKNPVVPILKFFMKGGPIVCFSMAARYIPEAFDDIKDVFFKDDEQIESEALPVSCTAVLAKKMGVSEAQVVMAAGLAGGIGLSGGGCGALGAAIWIGGLKGRERIENLSYADTWIGELIEKFLKSSDYTFECAEIAGRKFESVEDHAEYVRQGGCAKIIEALAEAEKT